jgi:hypothetical protein
VIRMEHAANLCRSFDKLRNKFGSIAPSSTLSLPCDTSILCVSKVSSVCSGVDDLLQKSRKFSVWEMIQTLPALDLQKPLKSKKRIEKIFKNQDQGVI